MIAPTTKKYDNPRLRQAYQSLRAKYGENDPRTVSARASLNKDLAAHGNRINPTLGVKGGNPAAGGGSVTETGTGMLNQTSGVYGGLVGGLGPEGRKQAQDATYSFLTQNFERDKAREMEDSKQELAQRGIPIDASNNSLWTKTIGGIDEKYKGYDVQAKNQAIMAGNEAYATDVNAVGTVGGVANSFLNTLTQADLAKLGLDQDKLLKLKQLEIERQKVAKMGSGGSGGGNSDTPFIIGGEAP